MLEHIRGRIVDKSPAHVVIESGGVGYRLLIPLSTYDRLPDDGEAKLFVSLYLRDNDVRLYGFYSEDERALFEALMSVSGVGPATALSVLSSADTESIRSAVEEGDVLLFQGVKGIGRKTAQRIILELKGYLERRETEELGGVLNDAVLALMKLGYPNQSAQNAVRAARQKLGKDATLEQLVREALKNV